jgi:hypothetical protein
MMNMEIHTFADFRRLCERHEFTPSQIAILAERIGFAWIDVPVHTSATLLDALEAHFRRYWEGRSATDEKPLFIDAQ